MAQNIKSVWVPGEGANHLELLPLNNTPPNVVASSAHSDYPAYFQIAQYAIQPGRPWKAAAIGTDDSITVDKNQMFNGGAEAGTLAGWTTNGDVLITSSPVHLGTKAFQLGADETEPSLYQHMKGRAGEKITVEAALRGNGGTVNVQIYIEELGLWLNTDGVTWQSAETVWFTRTGVEGSYTFKTSSPTLPAYSQLVPRGIFRVWVNIYGDDSYADSIAFWHWTDLSQILGHNAHPIISATELRCSLDNFVANNVLISGAFSTLIWPTSYALFTLRGERWWKLIFKGDNDVELWIGQWVLSQGSDTSGQYILDTVGRKPDYGFRFGIVQMQRRYGTTAAIETVILKEDIERREMTFTFKYQTEAQWREARNRLLRQNVMGKNPIVLIYDHTNPDSAAMVRLPERFDYSQPYPQGRHTDNLPLRELAFPTFD